MTRSSLEAYSAPLSPSSLRCRHNYEPGEYIAVVNGGAIRAGLDKGPVYTENVQAILPFKNEVRYCFVNGTVIEQMLEHSVRNDGPSGGFLSVHGLRFWWDPRAKPGSRVQRAEVLKQPSYMTEPLDYRQEYRLVASDFLLNGGDGYTMLRDGCRHSGHTVELLSRSMCAWHGLLVQELHSELAHTSRQVERSNKARQPHRANDRYAVRVVSRSGAGPFAEPGRNPRLCAEAAGFS